MSVAQEHQPRVLVVVGEFPPVGGGGVIRMVKLIKYLEPLGWNVTVICSVEPPLEHSDPSLLAEIPEGVRIVRVPHPFGQYAGGVASAAKARLGRRSIGYRFLRRFRALVRAPVAIPDRWAPWAARIALRPPAAIGRPDVILSSGPPHSVHILGRELARRFDAPLVMDLRDEWTLRPSNGAHSAVRRWIERELEARAIRSADRIVTVSQASASRYANRYPRYAGRFVEIPNGFDPADLSGLASAAGPSDEITIGYAGSFQESVDVRPLVNGLAAVAANPGPDRRVRVALLGPLRAEAIDAASEAIRADRLTVDGFVPHGVALRRMAEWDVLLIVANDGRASLAGKTYECLALRKPILLVAPEGPASRLIASSGAGAVADPADALAIERAARVCVDMSVQGFRGVTDSFLEPYDRRDQARRWSALLGNAVARDRSR